MDDAAEGRSCGEIVDGEEEKMDDNVLVRSGVGSTLCTFEERLRRVAGRAEGGRCVGW